MSINNKLNNSDLQSQEKIRALEEEVSRLKLENSKLKETLNEVYASAVRQEGIFRNPQQSENFANTRYSIYASPDQKNPAAKAERPPVTLKRVGPTGSGRSS
jgi:regulator of replication initiation timing